MDKLVLVSRHSILNRVFYGVPDLTNPKGLRTNIVYSLLNIVFRIPKEKRADHLAVAFDLEEPTFRHEVYDDYEGTRKSVPEELHQQAQVMKDVLTAMGVPIMTLPGFEANDILGTVAKKSQARRINVSAVSGDRGLSQLAGEHIKIHIPKTSRAGTKIKDYYPEDVREEYQIIPAELTGIKALMGDASDNTPGVPSIGEETATSLIITYGSIENCYPHLDEIKSPRTQKALREHYDMTQTSRRLATICLDCSVELRYEDVKIGDLYTPEAYQYMKRPEFKSLLTRFDILAVENSSESSLEKHFFLIKDEEETEKVFARADKCQVVGLQFITDRNTAAVEAVEQTAFSFDENGEVKTEKKMKSGLNPVTGLTLCFEEDEIYCMAANKKLSGGFLVRRARVLCTKRTGKATDEGMDKAEGTWVLDLKEMLPYPEIENTESVYDSRVTGYLLNPLKDAYVYDNLARDHLGLTASSKADLLAKADLGDTLWDEDTRAVICVCYMGYVTWKAVGPLKQQLEVTGMYGSFKGIGMPLIYSPYHVEKEGVKVERENLTEYENRLKVQVDELEQEIYKDTSKEFSINPSRQLGKILFEDMQLPGGKRTETGYSTAADVPDKLAPDCPVVQKILDYHQFTGLNSTYAQGLAIYIGEDGRIHGKLNQTIAATGRISSTEPNPQNIPIRMALGHEIRKVFVPEEGYVFVDTDYPQIELCILAHISGDGRPIEAYRSARGIHAITASEVFHVPLAEVTSLQRRSAKAANFGIVYDISAFGFSEDLSVSRRGTAEHIDKYLETYSGVEVFLDNLVSQKKEQGYVIALCRRIRPIPELKSASFMQRQFGERVAMNSPVQGSTADTMRVAMIVMDRELCSRNLGSRIVLQIHDEPPIEIARDKMEIARELLVDKMRHAASLKASLEVEAEVGDPWFDAR